MKQAIAILAITLLSSVAGHGKDQAAACQAMLIKQDRYGKLFYRTDLAVLFGYEAS